MQDKLKANIFTTKKEMRNFYCEKFQEVVKNTLKLPESGSGKRFHTLQWLQSIPRIKLTLETHFKPFFRSRSGKNQFFRFKNINFRENQIFSLNQGQESVFTVWECAQSIPRIKLPQESHLKKNFRPRSVAPPL